MTFVKGLLAGCAAILLVAGAWADDQAGHDQLAEVRAVCEYRICAASETRRNAG